MPTPDVFPIFTKAGVVTSIILPASGVKLAGGFVVKLNSQGRIANLPSGLTAVLTSGNIVKLAGGLKTTLSSLNFNVKVCQDE